MNEVMLFHSYPLFTVKMLRNEMMFFLLKNIALDGNTFSICGKFHGKFIIDV